MICTLKRTKEGKTEENHHHFNLKVWGLFELFLVFGTCWVTISVSVITYYGVTIFSLLSFCTTVVILFDSFLVFFSFLPQVQVIMSNALLLVYPSFSFALKSLWVYSMGRSVGRWFLKPSQPYKSHQGKYNIAVSKNC